MSKTDKQLDEIQFQYHDGWAECDPSVTLHICGEQVSCGETKHDALVNLLQRIEELKDFKKAVKNVVNHPKHSV